MFVFLGLIWEPVPHISEGPWKRITDLLSNLFSKCWRGFAKGNATVIQMLCSPKYYLNCDVQSQGGSYVSQITFFFFKLSLAFGPAQKNASVCLLAQFTCFPMNKCSLHTWKRASYHMHRFQLQSNPTANTHNKTINRSMVAKLLHFLFTWLQSTPWISIKIIDVKELLKIVPISTFKFWSQMNYLFILSEYCYSFYPFYSKLIPASTYSLYEPSWYIQLIVSFYLLQTFNRIWVRIENNLLTDISRLPWLSTGTGDVHNQLPLREMF